MVKTQVQLPEDDSAGDLTEDQQVKALIEKARHAGYERMVLDSHISMKKAHELYQSFGFRSIEKLKRKCYRINTTSEK